MNKPDELFILINSMNKNEKGYFHKFSGIHGSTGDDNYQKLFDCIAGMKEYDEQIIKAEFKGAKMLNHLKVTKHRLKNLIIRALRNYQEAHDPYVSDRMALLDTHIMLNRGLFKSASGRIQKEKQAAVEQEKFLPALQWIGLQEHLMQITYDVNGKSARQMLAEKQEIGRQYLNYHEYLFFHNIVTAASAKMTPDEMKTLNRVLKHRLFTSDKMLLSNSARIVQASTLSIIYMFTNEPAKAKQTLRNLLVFFEKPGNKNPMYPHTPLNQMKVLLNLTNETETEEMAAAIDKAFRIIRNKKSALTFVERNRFEAVFTYHEMRMYFLQHKPDAALDSAHRLDQLYKKWPPGSDESLWLCLYKAIAFLGLKQCNKGLAQVNIIINDNAAKLNYFVFEAYLLNIIFHLELRNYAIIRRQLTMASNFVKQTFSEPADYQWILVQLGKLSRQLQANDAKAVSREANGFLKRLKQKKILQKEYLEDWLETLK